MRDSSTPENRMTIVGVSENFFAEPTGHPLGTASRYVKPLLVD